MVNKGIRVVLTESNQIYSNINSVEIVYKDGTKYKFDKQNCVIIYINDEKNIRHMALK